MNITPIQNNYVNYSKNNNANSKNINFQKGLPAWFENETKKLNPIELERQLLEKGIKSDFLDIKSVANSYKKTIEIMENYGFKLPKEIGLEPLEIHIAGNYENLKDKINMNSTMSEIRFLRALDKREEYSSLSGDSQQAGHFLQTYIHEFTHSAHYNNLKNIWGEKNANEIWKELENYEPNDLMLGVTYSIFKKISLNIKPANTIRNFIFPAKNGQYAKKDLCEYIAEKNTRLICQDLGNNLTLKHTNQPPILNPQNYYNALELLLSKIDTPYTKELLEITSKYDKAIWNGDLSKLASLLKFSRDM